MLSVTCLRAMTSKASSRLSKGSRSIAIDGARAILDCEHEAVLEWQDRFLPAVIFAFVTSRIAALMRA